MRRNAADEIGRARGRLHIRRRTDPADAEIAAIGDVEVARSIPRESVGLRKTRRRPVAIEAAGIGRPGAAPAQDEMQIAQIDQDAEPLAEDEHRIAAEQRVDQQKRAARDR